MNPLSISSLDWTGLDEFLSRHPLGFMSGLPALEGLKAMSVSLTRGALEQIPEDLQAGEKASDVVGLVKFLRLRVRRILSSGPGTQPTPWFVSALCGDRVILVDIGRIRRAVDAYEGRHGQPCPLGAEALEDVILAHECFHALFEDLPRPREFARLREAGRVILEEVAARVFAVTFTQTPISPFLPDEILAL